MFAVEHNNKLKHAKVYSLLQSVYSKGVYPCAIIAIFVSSNRVILIQAE